MLVAGLAQAHRQEPSTARRLPDGGAFPFVHPAGHEAFHRTAIVGDAQGSEARADQRPHAVDDDLQHPLQAQLLRDGHGGLVQRLQAPAGLTVQQQQARGHRGQNCQVGQNASDEPAPVLAGRT